MAQQQKESVITPEMKKWIGVEGPPTIYEVEKGAIRKFCIAVGDTNPLYLDEEYAKKTKYGGIIAPLGFFGSAVSSGAFGQQPYEVSLKRVLNGGTEYEYIKPVRPGDTIISTRKITDFQERDGRLGRTLYTSSETVYRNQRGEVVAYGRGTTINY